MRGSTVEQIPLPLTDKKGRQSRVWNVISRSGPENDQKVSHRATDNALSRPAHQWFFSAWSPEEFILIGAMVVIAVTLTVGDSIFASAAVVEAGRPLGQLASIGQSILRSYWMVAFAFLGIAFYRFVALARD